MDICREPGNPVVDFWSSVEHTPSLPVYYIAYITGLRPPAVHSLPHFRQRAKECRSCSAEPYVTDSICCRYMATAKRGFNCIATETELVSKVLVFRLCSENVDWLARRMETTSPLVTTTTTIRMYLSTMPHTRQHV